MSHHDPDPVPAPATMPQRDFHHPYTPYDIQLDFMNAVYECIEQGRVGIFESPTGTYYILNPSAGVQ